MELHAPLFLGSYKNAFRPTLLFSSYFRVTDLYPVLFRNISLENNDTAETPVKSPKAVLYSNGATTIRLTNKSIFTPTLMLALIRAALKQMKHTGVDMH